LLVLLGAPVTPDGRPGTALDRRLHCALDLLRREPQARVLATGGVPPRACSNEPEAVVAAAWLQAHGIAGERILVEPKARNTWENAARSARLLGTLSARPPRLLLITDPWHLPRARLAFRAQGFRAGAASCTVGYDAWRPKLPRLLFREGFGLGAYALRWLLGSLRRGRRC
jgi:uncharacterized SAM-binding protein YcdF (DUF218 family)